LTFKLGPKSIANMAHLHPDMVAMAHRAIALSPIDWGFTEPLCRTLAQQKEKVRLGFSKTLKSNHLIQADGFGHAVDCVPWINGHFTWGGTGEGWPIVIDGDKIYPFATIANAWRTAAIEANKPVVWGAVWDRDLRQLPEGAENLHKAMMAYNVRHPGRDFNDGPHLQLGAP
jgi:peptidoglycan LD-endopeptidase CwlK